MGKLLKVMTGDGCVRAYCAVTTDIVSRAFEIFHSTPPVTAALGRTMTAASMMGSMLKSNNEAVTLQFRGDGPAGLIMAVSQGDGNVRGYVANPEANSVAGPEGKLDVGAVVGRGTLFVIKDLGMKDPYIGSTEIVTGEIGEDIAAYFAHSEQTPSACGLGVLIDTDGTCSAAGGFIIQLMPGAGSDVAAGIEKNVAALPHISAMVKEGLGPEDILARALAGFDIVKLEERTISYVCLCSEERVKRTLLSLGADELRSMTSDGKPIEITCRFCDRIYTYGTEALRGLLAEAEQREKNRSCED